MSAPSAMRRSSLPFFARPFPSLMDEILKSGGSQAQAQGRTAGQPPLRVWADEHALHVEVELPGATIEGLHLSVLADELSIQGERDGELPEGAELLHAEGHRGAFERRIQLPCEVQSEGVSAELRQGILTIVLPKADVLKPRQIPVQVISE